jgi:uncharacterized protein (TIGR03437 family)
VLFTSRLLRCWSHKCGDALVWASLILACCPALPAQSAGSYLINAIAGNGTDGFGGDTGPAVAAQLRNASGVAVDASGNVFIADAGNNRIRKVTPQGIITTVAGNCMLCPSWCSLGSSGGGSCPYGFSGDGGLAVSAQLGGPSGVAVDASGNLFIADSGNNRVRKVTPQGTITTVAGSGTQGFSADGGPAVSAQLLNPYGVAVNASGNLFIADGGNYRIRKVTPLGIITTVAGNGTQGFSGDGGSATSAQLGYPVGVAVDASGNLFVADSLNSRIREVTPQGTITTVAGNGMQGFSGDGGTAISAQLNYPSGVAVDASGNLFIADTNNNRIRMVTPAGIITTAAGNGARGFSGDGGQAGAAQLGWPAGVTVDASGKIYIGDSFNNRIRQLSPLIYSVGCVYSIDQAVQNVEAVGGTNSVGVLASGTSCSWLAFTFADWLSISPSSVASGTGIMTYAVKPNPESVSRVGTIWIAGKSLTVKQSGVVCSLGVSPRSLAVADSGLTGAGLSIASNAPDCRWTATASVPWILVSGGSAGTGSGTVMYTVGVNTGGLRTGTITVAGQKIYVNQAAAGASVSSLASITEPGVVNAATFSPPVSPGSFVTVYGQNLADTTTDWSSAITNGKLPTTLGGVQVLINGKNAVIYYVNPTQVNAIAQPDTATGPIEVDVITNHGTVSALVNMAPVSPGLFAYSLQGTLNAAAVFSSDGAYVGAVGAIPGVTSRPAQAGDDILLFATGLGPTKPAYPVGQVLTAAYPVPDLSQVSVLIGGKPATVGFAGMTYPGLFQINVRVPSGIPAGNQPIVLGVGGQVSLPAVYLTFGGG